MRNLKKLLALMLAFAMILSTATVSFAATKNFSDVTDADQQEAIALLTTLDVVNGYPDGSYKPGNVVTRAEMAKLVISALGYGDLATVTTSSYSDIGAASWAQGFVGLADGIGIVKGYPDGTFRPNNTVTYAEAATMIIRALGYTDEYLGGTWPNNYLAKALDLDLFDNTNMVGTGATRGDIAIMLFNAIDKTIGKVDNDNKWNALNASDDSIAATMIEKLGAAKLDAAVIDGQEDTAINLRPWVGVYASGYANDDDEIILLRQEDSLLVGDFDGAKFEVDGKDYTFKSGSTSDVAHFLNGELVTTAALSAGYAGDLDEYTLAADVSGSYIDKAYAISAWDATYGDMMSEDDVDAIMEDQEILGYEFALDDDDEIDEWSFELVGVDSVEDIMEDDVVYVYTNEAETEVTKVVVGTDTVTGVVSRVRNSGGDREFTVGGKVYAIADAYDYASSRYESFSIGEDDVKLYLDGFGDVWKLEVVEDASVEDWAVVLETGDGSGAGLTEELPVIKMFLADESDKIFDVDDEDISVVDTTWDAAWEGTTPAGTLVMYSLNGDDEVDGLVYADDDDYDFASATDSDISSRGYFKGYKIDSSAIIFITDSIGSDDEDDYSVASRSSILDMEGVDATYVVDKGDNVIVAMLITDQGDLGDTEYGVVVDYAALADDEFEVDMFVDGGAVTYTYAKDATPALSSVVTEPGLYEIKFNASSKISELIAVDGSEFIDEYTGVVIDVDGDIVTVDGDKYTMDTDVVVYKYDTADDDYEVIPTRDLEDYDSIMLYDVVDDDMVIDTIIVWED